VEDWLLGPPFAAGDLKRDAQCVENVVTMLAQAAAEAAKEISPAAAVAGAAICFALGLWFLMGSKFSAMARGFGLFLVCGFFTLGTSGQTV